MGIGGGAKCIIKRSLLDCDVISNELSKPVGVGYVTIIERAYLIVFKMIFTTTIKDLYREK